MTSIGSPTERDAACFILLRRLLRAPDPQQMGCEREGQRPKSCGMLDEEGSSLVEVALTFGILLMVVIGMLQMFLAVYAYHSMSEIAREATRYAIVRGADCINLPDCNADNTKIQTYAQGLGYPGIVSANLTTHTKWYTVINDPSATPANTAVVTLCSTDSPATGCNNPQNQVQVQVVYKFPLNVPYLPSTTITMTSTSAMIISQ